MPDQPVSSRKQQHQAAVQWCRRHQCGSRAALTQNPGKWPLVSKGTLDPLTQGKRTFNSAEHHRAVLTDQERQDLAETCRKASDSGCPPRKKDRDKYVLDILRWRKAQNIAGEPGFVKLTPPAVLTLERGKASRKFWRAFFKEFKDLSANSKVATTSMQRAKQCTRAVAEGSLLKLRDTLRSMGIYMQDEDCFVPGKEGNLIWLDEFNQFFNYLLPRGNNLKRTTRKGQRARQACTENRGTFTGSGAIGFDKFMYDFQMIFSLVDLHTDMAPDCIKELEFALFSVTDGGCQTGETFLEWLKSLEAQARSRGITGPICFATDGHSSRFWIENLRWLRKTSNDLFITPPEATRSCCMLDQIFQDAHSCYDDLVMDLKHDLGPDVSIGVNEAVQIFVQMWKKPWCSYKQRCRGFKNVGLDEGRISIDFMPDKQFKIGEAIAAAAAEGEQLAIEAPPVEEEELLVPTPDASITRGTKAYYAAKVHCLRVALETEKKRKLSPLQMGVLRASWFKPKPPKKKRRKINSVTGSMDGSMLLEKRDEMEEAGMTKEKEKQDAIKAKEAAFELCIAGCNCGQDNCAATGLVKCAACDQVKERRCKVYWSMLDPPAWYNGTVAKIGKARLKIDYPIEDEYQWHDPNTWDIQKVSSIATAEENDDGDSDDDMSLGALFPK